MLSHSSQNLCVGGLIVVRGGGSFVVVLPGAPRRILLVAPPWLRFLQPLLRDARPPHFRRGCGGSALPCCLWFSLRSTFCRLDAAVGLVREYLHTCACVCVCVCVWVCVETAGFLSFSFQSSVRAALHTQFLQALLDFRSMRKRREGERILSTRPLLHTHNTSHWKATAFPISPPVC